MTMCIENIPFLKVHDVWKSYPAGTGQHGGKTTLGPVLKGVTFSIRKGSITGLLGESGSGKSTLSRQILGLEKPDAGEILIAGMPIGDWRRDNPGKMSVVFQNYTTSIDPSFTVEEAIGEGFRAASKKAYDRKDVVNLLEKVGISANLIHRLPNELSGGQAQRICIARSVAQNPDIIVFDEAVSALDAPVQVQIVNLLKEIHGTTTCLFITHDIQIASMICDDIVVLHDGIISDRFSISNMVQHPSPYLRGLLSSTVIFESSYKG